MASRAVVVLGISVAAVALAGCGSSNTAAARDSKVRGNLTPELMTLSQRPVDVDNRVVLSSDENLRMANEDLIRMWYLDRPSRLSRTRIPR